MVRFLNHFVIYWCECYHLAVDTVDFATGIVVVDMEHAGMTSCVKEM